MLNFFIILLTNIFTGVVLYLVLTLKLERSSSEYQHEKFKREAAEVIREFNASAERNISVLENRMSQLKRLLELSGAKQGVDTRVDEVLSTFTEEKKEQSHEYSLTHDFTAAAPRRAGDIQGKVSYLVDDALEIPPFSADDGVAEVETLSDKISTSPNKNETLADLFKGGHSIEILSSCSGMSAAEIELILKLKGIDIEKGAV